MRDKSSGWPVHSHELRGCRKGTPVSTRSVPMINGRLKISADCSFRYVDAPARCYAVNALSFSLSFSLTLARSIDENESARGSYVLSARIVCFKCAPSLESDYFYLKQRARGCANAKYDVARDILDVSCKKKSYFSMLSGTGGGARGRTTRAAIDFCYAIDTRHKTYGHTVRQHCAFPTRQRTNELTNKERSGTARRNRAHSPRQSRKKCDIARASERASDKGNVGST